MRIDPNLVVPPVILETTKPAQSDARPARSRGGTKPPGAPSGASSVVELSTAGAAVSAESVSPRTTTRLERIREMLDAGDYPVDLDLLASRIVDDELARTSGGKP